jgi:hypothetical protein
MEDPDASDQSMVLSHRALRKAVGAIGILLPFVLAGGHMLAAGSRVEGSLSAYYWTEMRDVLVGSLCAIAVLLFAYRGPDKADDFLAHFAGISAVGVALAPSRPDGPFGLVHYVFTASFFVALACFSLVLFRKTDLYEPPTARKLLRNQVYAACGCAMLACVALIGLVAFTRLGELLGRYSPVFWLESVALFAFGLSWFTKSGAILKDEQPWGSEPTITGPL